MVSRPDLVHDDAGMQDSGDFPDRLAKIHPALGSEVERDLCAVKGPFGFDQLHWDFKKRNLFFADFKRFRLTPLPALPPLPVFGRRQAQQTAHRAGCVGIRRGPQRRFDEPKLRSVLAFRDYGGVRFQRKAIWVAERDFSERLKDDSGN